MDEQYFWVCKCSAEIPIKLIVPTSMKQHMVFPLRVILEILTTRIALISRFHFSMGLSAVDKSTDGYYNE